MKPTDAEARKIIPALAGPNTGHGQPPFGVGVMRPHVIRRLHLRLFTVGPCRAPSEERGCNIYYARSAGESTNSRLWTPMSGALKVRCSFGCGMAVLLLEVAGAVRHSRRWSEKNAPAPPLHFGLSPWGNGMGVCAPGRVLLTEAMNVVAVPVVAAATPQ